MGVPYLVGVFGLLRGGVSDIACAIVGWCVWSTKEGCLGYCVCHIWWLSSSARLRAYAGPGRCKVLAGFFVVQTKLSALPGVVAQTITNRFTMQVIRLDEELEEFRCTPHDADLARSHPHRHYHLYQSHTHMIMMMMIMMIMMNLSHLGTCSSL